MAWVCTAGRLVQAVNERVRGLCVKLIECGGTPEVFPFLSFPSVFFVL
jgi:hypothetical protein